MSYKQIIDQVEIPSYTRKQEVFNGISHFLGLPVALMISIAILIAYLNRNIPLNYFVGVFIFVLSISAVYLVSTTYHLIDANACFYKR